MGLLDSLLYNQNGYGGQGGGLLDMLQNSLMQQNNYQPSTGFPQQQSGSGRAFDSATFDPATYAPSQPANTIGVGNYQMPRIGNPDQFQPQQAMTPPTAQPTQGQTQQPPQSQQPDQQLPPALGGNSFGGNFGAGLQNFVNAGGPLQALAGGLTGLVTGQRTDPQGMSQQNLNAQYQALRQAFQGSGMSPQEAASKAMLAVMNPEAGKTLINEALTNKTDIKMVKDAYGQEHPYSWNPLTQEFKPLGGGASAGGNGDLQSTTDKISAMGQSGATREQMLKEVPADFRGHVQAVLEGRALPSNIGRGSARGAIMAAAHAIDPNFDESTIPLRFKTSGDYAPNGQSGRSIVALNTVQHHIGKLSDDIENMGDTGWTVLNSIRNGIAVNTPIDPKQGTAVQAVQDDIKAVTDEMSAAYKAGKVSDHEIEAWNKLANSNLPLRQLKQGIYDFVGLLNGKRDQLNETHQAILGRDAPGINKDLNESITKKVGERNSGTTSAANASAVQEGATATNPQTGAKITFRNGKWQ